MTHRAVPRRLMIVDDDPAVRMVLAESLEKLGDQFTIDSSRSGVEALDKVCKGAFDLIITDLKMPGMDGLELMAEVRKLHPRTRLILMTAYGSADVEATAYRLGACRYIEKPFQIPELLAEVQTALAKPELPGRGILVLGDAQFDAIAQYLADLQFEVGAQCILLATVTGQLVAHVGKAQDVDLSALISLVGGSFATAFAMARILQESRALTLNYHEGVQFDIYSSNVNQDLFIVLMFDKRPRRRKGHIPERRRIGMVWLYTRRALERLRACVDSADRAGSSQVLDADFGTLLSDSLNQVLIEPTSSVPAPPAKSEASDTTPGADALPATGETFNLQQALDMGLLNATWSGDPQGGR